MTPENLRAEREAFEAERAARRADAAESTVVSDYGMTYAIRNQASVEGVQQAPATVAPERKARAPRARMTRAAFPVSTFRTDPARLARFNATRQQVKDRVLERRIPNLDNRNPFRKYAPNRVKLFG